MAIGSGVGVAVLTRARVTFYFAVVLHSFLEPYALPIAQMQNGNGVGIELKVRISLRVWLTVLFWGSITLFPPFYAFHI